MMIKNLQGQQVNIWVHGDNNDTAYRGKLIDADAQWIRIERNGRDQYIPISAIELVTPAQES